MTSKPDSIVGWFKATPQAGDRANVGALLHVDEGRLPAFGTEGNYVAGASWKAPYGNVGEWTRFSAPFQYLNDWQPEWILLILTAGDSAGSQVGTQAWFDDLALIYNVQCAPEPQSVAPGQSFNVGYSTGGVPQGAVTFTAELSDANGSFASPVAIGTLATTNAAGTIACAVPLGIDAGAGYRIRVVGSSPFYAPVGCDLTIEVGTGLEDGLAVGAMIALRGEQLIAHAERPGALECFNSDGRLLLSASLREGLNTIDLDDMSGMLLVRVTDARGVHAKRLIAGR